MLAHDRAARTERPGLPGRRTATSITRCAISPATASCRASRSTTCAPASASTSTPASAIRSTSCCGKSSKESEPDEVKWDSQVGQRPAGLAHRMLGHVVRDCWANSSTSTAAAPTCSSRTTKTRSPSPKARSATPMVNYWMHNGFVRVDNEKMSKSLGNFFTIRDVLKKYDAEVVRFFILRAHYRSPLNYSDVHLDDAQGSADPPVHGAGRRRAWQTSRSRSTGTKPMPCASRDAMDDDFNTPLAVAALFDLATRSQQDQVGRRWRASSRRWPPCSACSNARRSNSCKAAVGGRGRPGRSGDRGADRAPRSAAKKARDFAESDKHPRRLAGGGHHPRRQARRHDQLAPRMMASEQGQRRAHQALAAHVDAVPPTGKRPSSN